MANSCVLTMYYADCTGNAKNNKYSHRIDVVDIASLIVTIMSVQNFQIIAAAMLTL